MFLSTNCLNAAVEQRLERISCAEWGFLDKGYYVLQAACLAPNREFFLFNFL